MASGTLDLIKNLYAAGKAPRAELAAMEALFAAHHRRQARRGMNTARLQAYLDDLARLTVRHGLRLDLVESMTVIVDAEPDWGGYGVTVGTDGAAYLDDRAPSNLEGLDPRSLSAHERLQIVGGQFGPVRHRPCFRRKNDDLEAEDD